MLSHCSRLENTDLSDGLPRVFSLFPLALGYLQTPRRTRVKLWDVAAGGRVQVDHSLAGTECKRCLVLSDVASGTDKPRPLQFLGH